MWAAGTEEPSWVTASTAEGAQLMLPREQASPEEVAEEGGTLVTDDRLYDDEQYEEETTILNMGPQHPSTHGVLRLQLELEGEIVRRVKPVIGYLHTGMEKTGETLTFLQGPTNVTRMDYLAPFHNELCFSLATEALLGVELPPRALAIRVLMTELNRVSSHLTWVATQGMDLGAVSMMIYGIRERELLLAFFEKTTGLRMNHNYIRPGGVAADLPDGWEEDVAEIIEATPKGLDDYHDLLTHNPIFLGRTQGVGVITPEECFAYGITGPPLRAAGVDWDLRKSQPYSGIEQYDFDVPLGRARRRVRPLPGADGGDAPVAAGSSPRSPSRCRPATTGPRTSRSPRRPASASMSRWKRSSTTSRSSPRDSRCRRASTIRPSRAPAASSATTSSRSATPSRGASIAAPRASPPSRPCRS